MLYLALLFLLICGVYIEWSLNGFEAASPVSLMLLGLALADVLAMIGRGSWNGFDLSVDVFLILAFGSAALLLGSCLAYRMRASLTRKSSRRLGLLVKADSVAIWKYIVLMLLVLVAIVLRMSETYKLASELGADTSSYSAAAKAVRAAYASFNSADGMQAGKGFSFLSKQMSKAEGCISYIAVFLLAQAIVNRRKKDICASFLLAASCWAYVIISGSRGDMLYQGIAFAVVLYVLLLRNGYPVRKLTIRFFLTGAVVGIFLSIGFWLSSALVGRKTNSGFVEYISFYYGCGLPSLESILESGNIPQVVPGLRTFYYVFALPYRFGFISAYPSYSISWVNLGTHTSNVFTGFARYYLDFGIVGMVLLSFISSFIFTKVYKSAKNTSGCIAIILTGYFCAQCFDFAREEFLFSRFLSTSSVVWLFILIVLVLFTTTDLRELRNCISGRIEKNQE